MHAIQKRTVLIKVKVALTGGRASVGCFKQIQVISLVVPNLVKGKDTYDKIGLNKWLCRRRLVSYRLHSFSTGVTKDGRVDSSRETSRSC